MSDILRWVADQYRAKLSNVNPQACREIDLIMVRAGQTWICDETVVDPDELLTAKEIEAKHGITENSIQKLALRYGIKCRGKKGKAYLYRLGDVLSARAAKKCFD